MTNKSHAVGWGSDSPAPAQIKEFFAQIESGRITKAVLQKLLRGQTDLTPEEVRAIWLARFFKLGYPKAIGMSYEKFVKLAPIPENRPGALMVVKNELVSVDIQMKLIGGTDYLDLACLRNVVETPKTLIYWRYGVEDGKKVLNRPPDACVEIFKKENRIPAVVEEGIAIYVQNPRALKDHSVNLPGSRYNSDVPCLELSLGLPPRLCYGSSGSAFPRSGSASCKS